MDECEHVHQWQHLEIGQVMTAAHAFSLLPRILLSSLVIEYSILYYDTDDDSGGHRLQPGLRISRFRSSLT